MAAVAGRVIFDRDRSATFSGGDSGIANIPVVLQNIGTNERLTVLTDANGNYSFINVPAGNYRVVESYGTQGGVPSPGDFDQAETGSIPQGVNPPITAVAAPPAGSTNLDSVTPDTLFVTVNTADVVNQNFLNGPVIYTPIGALVDLCAVVSGENLIEAADNGTFGSFPAGTPANTGAPVEPYPDVTPDFTYVLPNPDIFAPMGGEYTVENIMNDARSEQIGAWWRIADHTSGNETGRMMVVNGYNPGAVFFRAVVEVTENTSYLFTAWILNLFRVTGYPNPELGVRVLDENGGILYSAALGLLIPPNVNAPEWKQFGTVLNSGNNTSLTVEFLSEGPEVIGNDYAIDDVAFQEIEIRQFVPVKTASTSAAGIGEIFDYTVTLTNTCENPLTDVFFRDLIPQGLTFVSGSVTVNGTTFPQTDPAEGFTLPDVAGGQTATVRFSVVADAVPEENPTINRATVNYSYTPVEGGIPAAFQVESNEVLVEISGALADLSVVKTAGESTAVQGTTLTYTITVSNAGPSPAEDVLLRDTVPASITDVEYSVDGGTTFDPWSGMLSLGTLLAGETQTILIRGIVSAQAAGTLVNTAVVTSSTPDPDPDNNSSTITTGILTPRCQALVDLVESVALQEAALARILNAEGQKMQAFINLEGVTNEELFRLNDSVTSMIGTVSRLEIVLQAKLQNVSCQLNGCLDS